ncbi:hypothetical protein HYU95_00440 [Candidatus Daviesbacteria bacterium]|nr:hypothetical protein [Candidatus Daviesbacteria bacterium]
MRIGIEREAFKAVTLEGISEFHAAQIKAGMNGPLVDVCCLIGGGISGIVIYPVRRIIARQSPETIIQQSKSRIDSLSNY